MVRFQIPWARKHLFDSDLGERTGGSAPVLPPHTHTPPTKSPVSGREGFSAGLGHCSFWVIGRPTAVCLELERRSKQSSPLLPRGRDWGAGEEDGFASSEQQVGVCKAKGSLRGLCFLGCPAQGEEAALLSEK